MKENPTVFLDAVGGDGSDARDLAYRQLVEHAHDVIYFCDRLGRITFANEAASELLGYSRDELLGRHVLEFAQPDYHGVRDFYLQAPHDKPQSTYVEAPALAKDGRIVWLSQYVQSRVEGGRIIGTQAIARDITDRIRIERELKDSEQRLELAIAAADLGLWDWNVDRDTLTVNDRWARMLGQERNEIDPHFGGLKQLVHPDDIQQVSDVLEEHLDGGTSLYEAEFRMRHKSGTWVWILARGRVMERDADGRSIRMTGTHLDISDRKRNENALFESKNRMQLLYAVTSRRTEDVSEQIEDALRVTATLLGMDVGMLSKIEGSSYIVEHCYAPESDLRSGARYKLGHTYCSLVLTANDVVAISHTRLSQHSRHPCYGVFKLESYIGLPIYVYDELYGTLNFSSKDPRAAPFSKEDKHFIRMLGAWISSTLANRKTVVELRESEKKYRSSFDYAPIGKAHVSRDGEWLQVNDALCRIVGYREDELLDKTFQDITHPEDLDLDLSYLKNMLARKIDSYSLEKRYFKKDGNVVWVLLTVSAVFDEDDEVSYFVAQVQDISAQKELEHQLIRQAQHDALTGLANRSVFMGRLSEELAWCKNDRSETLAVLFLDFDRFKFVNDSLGHTRGDRLLIAVAERIKSALRTGDLFARLGGDEFGILLPGLSSENQATMVAERIQNCLREPVQLEDQEVFPSASIGIVINGGTYDHPEEVLRDADTAMYQAKEDGGAGYRIFSEEMHVQASERLRMDSELRRAVDNEEFIPYYQPIVDLTTGELTGFEALARWDHPVHGIIGPERFVEHAEKIGIIREIDRQIFARSCRQLKTWQSESTEPVGLVMHVNCSAKHLLDASFAPHIARLLEETRLAPSALVVELTESVFIEDMARASQEIQRLKHQGVHMCIDDFGTGYSSLNALHTLPIHALKIDRGFLASMHEEGRRRRIVHTTMDLANRLEMTVIAEGIEDERQLATLRELNCRFGQGYLFSRPLSAEEAKLLVDQPLPWRRLWQ